MLYMCSFFHSDSAGKCFIQTSSLDGETNLKIRVAHSLTVNDMEGTLHDLHVSTYMYMCTCTDMVETQSVDQTHYYTRVMYKCIVTVAMVMWVAIPSSCSDIMLE